MLRGPEAIDGSPRERALASLGARVTEAPWNVSAADIDRLREGGVSAEGIEQAITVAANFSYYTRVADATGIEFDYASPLPRIEVDREREPQPRPVTSKWNPGIDGSASPPFRFRPQTAAAVQTWREYVLERDAPISRRDRRVIARAVAEQLCDSGGLAHWSDAAPHTDRERSLALFAEKLTRTPWRMSANDLAPLRGHGIDDTGLLHAITLVAHLNAVTRMHYGLAATA